MKRGKKYRDAAEKIERGRQYSLQEALPLIKEISQSKFDATIECVANLGVDPRHADQQVRGTVGLPHGTGRSVRVLVFADGADAQAAKDAGADYVGLDEYAEKIQKENWFDFDVAIAVPSAMRVIGRLGRVLGPRGLMPNPKTGTVTADVGRAVTEFKAGKIEYRCDRAGVVHAPVGKASFELPALEENVMALMGALMKARPSAAKGLYLKSVFISATMSPSIRIDPACFRTTVGAKA
jgi:large subunit ribosomal protein L1